MNKVVGADRTRRRATDSGSVLSPQVQVEAKAATPSGDGPAFVRRSELLHAADGTEGGVRVALVAGPGVEELHSVGGVGVCFIPGVGAVDDADAVVEHLVA